MAKFNFLSGYNPGITAHYSSNAIYLSIGVIIFFTLMLNSRKNIHKIFFSLFVVALLLTAKRAHLLFTAISCFITFFISDNSTFKNKIKIILRFFLLSCFIVLILSFAIPSIKNVFIRFINGNLLSGRESYYYSLIKIWKSNIFFGKGWGYFSYYFQNNLFDIHSMTSNLEYLDGHNVYLQLLAECGVLGAFYIIGIFSLLIYENYNILRRKTYNKYNLIIFNYLLFFSLYCFSGNPLYDPQCYVLLFIFIGFILCNIRGKLIINKYFSKLFGGK